MLTTSLHVSYLQSIWRCKSSQVNTASQTKTTCNYKIRDPVTRFRNVRKTDRPYKFITQSVNRFHHAAWTPFFYIFLSLKYSHVLLLCFLYYFARSSLIFPLVSSSSYPSCHLVYFHYGLLMIHFPHYFICYSILFHFPRYSPQVFHFPSINFAMVLILSINILNKKQRAQVIPLLSSIHLKFLWSFPS